MEEGMERLKDQKDEAVCCETVSPIHNREGTAMIPQQNGCLKTQTITNPIPIDSITRKGAIIGV